MSLSTYLVILEPLPGRVSSSVQSTRSSEVCIELSDSILPFTDSNAIQNRANSMSCDCNFSFFFIIITQYWIKCPGFAKIGRWKRGLVKIGKSGQASGQVGQTHHKIRLYSYILGARINRAITRKSPIHRSSKSSGVTLDSTVLAPATKLIPTTKHRKEQRGSNEIVMLVK